MSDRLFDIDEVPEVPLFREPRGSRGAAIMDERIDHDYPPAWNRCPTCEGKGKVFGPVEEGAADANDEVLFVWSIPADDDMALLGRTGPVKMRGIELASPDRHPRNAVGTYLGFRRRNVVCEDCLGMGSVKARVRLEAGHRCVRCLHPYVPKRDAKMLNAMRPLHAADCPMTNSDARLRTSCLCGAIRKLGISDERDTPEGDVEPTPHRWSPCDGRCRHVGTTRISVDGGLTWEIPVPGKHYVNYDIGLLVDAEWRILTVHHLDGDKANLAWWNLAALCQRCHLEIQAKVVMERVYPHEHSDWFKPYVAGYYARVYLGEEITREEAIARMDELLALERTP